MIDLDRLRIAALSAQTDLQTASDALGVAIAQKAEIEAAARDLTAAEAAHSALMAQADLGQATKADLEASRQRIASLRALAGKTAPDVGPLEQANAAAQERQAATQAAYVDAVGRAAAQKWLDAQRAADEAKATLDGLRMGSRLTVGRDEPLKQTLGAAIADVMQTPLSTEQDRGRRELAAQAATQWAEAPLAYAIEV